MLKHTHDYEFEKLRQESEKERQGLLERIDFESQEGNKELK